ncbi:sugar transferase [Telmatospirillum siberiense]|nr:sugar transferase [Telmatospirillum siberiense]
MGLQHITSIMLQREALASASLPGFSGGYDWRRLHAAAIDRSPIDRGRFVRLKEPAHRISKRLFDVVATSFLLALLSPLLLSIAVMARRDGGPVVYGHRRIGAHGRTFKCWKFRTMVPNADKVLEKILASDPTARAEWERDFKLKNDPRITPVGRLLRVTSLDELPQLFNVIAGDMSLVGPRPIVTDEVRRYGAAFHDYARCRPGITGIWQISGRNDVGYGQRVDLDRHYARSWSFARDILILLRTPFAVLRRSGAY